MWSRCSVNMLKAAKNGKELMYLPDRTLLRKEYSIVHGLNQDTCESKKDATSKYPRRTSVTLNHLRKTREYGHPNR